MARRWAARLYVPGGLSAGAAVALPAGQAHYLRIVLRLSAGAAVATFNAAEGEWLCRLETLGKRAASLLVERRLRPPGPEPDLWLVFAPVKRARLDWLIEKACELGASALIPVWTARTQPERINLDRLRAHAIEAAEQCERLGVPELRALAALDRLLAEWPSERALIVCDESGAGAPAADALAPLAGRPAAVLVGPEGGFAEAELNAFGRLPIVTRIGLGPRVLRAETAALAALAVFQAVAGDGRGARRR